jgi:hypothetical protein
MYLSSPIEFSYSLDDNWRESVTDTLTKKFQINVFDPFADEKQKQTTYIEKALEVEDFDEVERITTRFVKKDFGVIDRCDFLIAYNPRGIPSTGIPCEVHHALQIKKPVMIVCPQGKKFAALWYFGNMRHQYIFGHWNDLYQYLQEVDSYQHRDNHRWWYVYKMI